MPTPLVCLSHSPNPLQRKTNEIRVICQKITLYVNITDKKYKNKKKFLWWPNVKVNFMLKDILIAISRMKLNKVKMWMIDLKLILYICTYTSVFPNPANCFPCLPCGLLGGGFAADGLGICTTISSLSESYHDKWKYESQHRWVMYKKYQG